MRFESSQIDGENTWQIGTGDGSRSYFDVFLKYGVALVGPGDPGREGLPETEEYYKNSKENNWGRVLNQVKEGHWLIARKGKSVILAVGQVVKPYDYSEFFADVDGWDLQHFVRVRWYVPATHDSVIHLERNVLSQSTLQGCYAKEVYDAIYNTEFQETHQPSQEHSFSAPLKLTTEQITDALIDKGMRIADAENISGTITRIIRLADWYASNDFNACESELVSFLILPFLIALGWSEQKIKLEYHHADIALFTQSFKGDYATSPTVIIEAKKYANGLAFTDGQIKTYAEKFPSCERFVATNGFRYKYYVKRNSNLECIGSFNLRQLTESNSLYEHELSSVDCILAVSALT